MKDTTKVVDEAPQVQKRPPPPVEVATRGGAARPLLHAETVREVNVEPSKVVGGGDDTGTSTKHRRRCMCETELEK